MADFAEDLARTYMKRGESSGDWKDYLKAHGLANYCVAVDSTPERCRLVYDVEVSWYKGSHPISYGEHQQLTNQHKQLLNTYRDEVKYNFKPLDVLGLSLDAEDVYGDENMTTARKFCDELFELSKRTSDEFVQVVRSIIESSVETLKRTKRDVPCNFAVIGLGSVAKGEATPYSDVEYAFITERDDKDYFEMLAMDSYFRIGNVGETPLKCFNIEELKVAKESPPIIPDLKTVGFRIDGISRSAGNIPTGNGLEKGQSLTFTVDNFMKLYKTSAESPFTGLADKSDMLSSTVVIYTNEGHESQLHNRFIEERLAYELNVAQYSTVVKEKRMKLLHKDIDTFTFLPEFVKYQPPQNMNIKVKTDIFRYPTLLANNIKMFTGWNLRYPWQIYSKLYSCEKMSEETHSYIRIVLALSIYMRTRAYLHQRSQTEYVSLLPQATGSVKELYQVPSSLFVILGCLLTPIKLSVRSKIESMSLTADDRSLADVVESVMQHIKFDKTNLLAKVEICYFAGEYELALKELSEVVKAPVGTTTSLEFLEKIQQTNDDHSAVTKYMELCCYILYHTKSYRAATDLFSWLIEKGCDKIGFWKLLSAHCRKAIGHYKATRQLLDEASQHFQQAHSQSKCSSKHSMYAPNIKHSDISDSYRDIGSVYRDMGEYKEAIKYLKLALEMDIAMFGETVHADIAADYCSMGSAYDGLGEYTSAFDCLIKSLEMMHAIYGADTNHPDIAEIYGNIALVYNHRGVHKFSLEYDRKSLDMKKAIYGADTNHPTIANSYNNIALAYADCGNYALSLQYHFKSWEMMKAMYGADTNHPDIPISYNNIALVYADCGDYTLSLQYHFKSLEMMKAIYGADANHPEIASSYNNIGLVYSKCGDHTLSLEYHIKSLEMKKVMYGTDMNHPDIAISYNNIGIAYKTRDDNTLSLEYHTKSLNMMKAIYGADANHSDIAANYNNIASAHNGLGEHTLSLEYYTKSITMMKAIYGVDANHPGIAMAYCHIAGIYNGFGDHTLSLEYHIKSLKMKRAIFGTATNHPDIANSYNHIANVHYKCSDYTVALAFYTKSLKMMKAVYGADTNHPDIATTFESIACVHNKQGNHRSSLKYHNKSLKMRKATYDVGTNYRRGIATCYNNIAQVYYTCGDYTSSLEYYMKLLEMF